MSESEHYEYTSRGSGAHGNGVDSACPSMPISGELNDVHRHLNDSIASMHATCLSQLPVRRYMHPTPVLSWSNASAERRHTEPHVMAWQRPTPRACAGHQESGRHGATAAF